MNSDLSKELLRKINKSFTLSYQKSEKVRKLLLAIKNKDCDYLKAMEYAEEVGKILAEAYMKNLSSDVLPDGKMYYDIASAILNPTLENNYGLISSYVCGAMEIMNEKAGIEAKARKPSYNVDKTLGLIKKVSDAEYFDDVKNYLNEPVITNALSIVDEGARVNADLHYNMNRKPIIVRRASFGCCDWCRRLAGTQEYYPTMNRDIFRRHQNCRCTVIYDPRNSDGKVQDVYTKDWKKRVQEDNSIKNIICENKKVKLSDKTKKSIKESIEIIGKDPNYSRDSLTALFPEKTYIGQNPFTGRKIYVYDKDFSYFVKVHVLDHSLDYEDLVSLNNILDYDMAFKSDEDNMYSFIKQSERKNGAYDVVLKVLNDEEEIFHFNYKSVKSARKNIKKLMKKMKLLDVKSKKILTYLNINDLIDLEKDS